MKIKRKSIVAVPIEIIHFICFFPQQIFQIFVTETVFYYKDTYEWERKRFALLPVESSKGNLLWLEMYVKVTTQGMMGAVTKNLSIEKGNGFYIGFF